MVVGKLHLEKLHDLGDGLDDIKLFDRNLKVVAVEVTHIHLA